MTDNGESGAALFVREDFTSHAGLSLHWKIECDALTDEDWQALAQIASEVLPPFGEVHGIPRGGLAFAEALRAHTTRDCWRLLIADDVLTTGMSMEDARTDLGAEDSLGVVAFSRCQPMHVPGWVTPLFQLADIGGYET